MGNHTGVGQRGVPGDREAGDWRCSLRWGAFVFSTTFSRAVLANMVATGSVGWLKLRLKSMKMK